jgi:hypothetical protein
MGAVTYTVRVILTDDATAKQADIAKGILNSVRTAHKTYHREVL